MLNLERHRQMLQQCSIVAALEVIGERWSFLIVRGAFNDLSHFEEFQATLGIARNILSNRLAKLVEHEILQREPDATDRRKVAYRLTDKGRDLLPVLISLRQWGEKWISDEPSNPVLVDRMTRQPVLPMAVRASDGRNLALGDLEWLDRPEASKQDTDPDQPEQALKRA